MSALKCIVGCLLIIVCSCCRKPIHRTIEIHGTKSIDSADIPERVLIF